MKYFETVGRESPAARANSSMFLIFLLSMGRSLTVLPTSTTAMNCLGQFYPNKVAARKQYEAPSTFVRRPPDARPRTSAGLTPPPPNRPGQIAAAVRKVLFAALNHLENRKAFPRPGFRA